MPLYEWRCQMCGSKFEVLTSYENSLGEMICTHCHSTNVRKLVSVFARPSRGGDDAGDSFDSGDFADEAGDGFGGGGCGCGGGGCSCHN